MTGIVCSMVGASFTVAAAAEVIRKKKGITAVGNAQVDTAQSKFGGSSALFDGTGDRLVVNSSAQFGFSGDFTIEAWVRFTNFTNTPIIFDFRTSSDGAVVKPTLYFSNTGVPTYYTNGSARITGNTLSTGTWYHIALSRSSTSTKLFVDGTQVGTTYTDSNNYVESDLHIGEYPGGGFGLNGWVDEFRISKSARYTANFTPSTTAFVNDDNTLLLLHMNGTDASTFFEDDNGVRASNGIIAAANAQVDTAQSKFGGASAYFDGTGDACTIEHNGTMRFGTGDFTIEFWYRPTSRSKNYPVILSNRNGFSSGNIVFHDRHASNTSKLTVWIYNYSTGAPAFTASTSTVDGTWYHIALTRSGTSIKLFVNGTQEGSTITSSLDIDTGAGTSPYYLSFPGSDSEFNGHIDEVRVSNTARYTTTFTPTTTPFVNDANTLLLIHADGTNGSTVFRDDNGVRAPKGIAAIGNAQIDTAQSKFGGSSALFDGTGDYLLVNSDPAFAYGTGDYTIEFWVYNSAWATEFIFDQRTTGTQIVPAIYYNGGIKVYVNGSDIISGGTLTANAWHHIALVKSGSDHKLYYNGTQTGSTYSYGGTYVQGGNLTIGTRYAIDTSYSGWIDEFRISNTARYTANFTAPTAQFQNDSNTLLLLHMDGTDASTVFFDDNGRDTTPTA